MARRGRKRKAGQREPNGQPQRRLGPDRGTEQLQTHRRALVGNSGDQRVEHPLGVLSANNYIDAGEYDALMAYQRLRWAAYGRPFARTSLAESNGRAGGELRLPADATLADIVSALRELPEERRRRACDTASLALKSVGRLGFEEVRQVAVFDRLPSWFRTTGGNRPRPADARRFEAFKFGAQALALHFRTLRRGARGQI